MKPPKFGNCREEGLNDEQHPEERITFEEFKEAFKDTSSQSEKRKRIENLSNKLRKDKLVKFQNWEAPETLQMEDVLSTELLDNIIYSNCGFLCRKMTNDKIIKNCSFCMQAFSSNEDNWIFPIANLIDIRSRGKLIYANLELFRIIKSIDCLYIEHHGNNVYQKVVDTIISQKMLFTFPCDEHKVDVISCLIDTYLLLNLWHYRRNDSRTKTKRSKEFKKEAKLKSS